MRVWHGICFSIGASFIAKLYKCLIIGAIHMKKTLLSAAVVSAMTLAGAAQAVTVTSMTLSDVWNAGATTLPGYFNNIGGTLGSDGAVGRFGFNAATTGGSFTGDTGVDMLFEGAQQGPSVFTTGFIFATQPFLPMTNFGAYGLPSPGINADITGNSLTFSSLGFGGLFAGTNPFWLAPDAGTLKINFLQDIGGGDYAAAFSWTHTITSAEDPSFQYVGQKAHWVIEGVMHTVPVPAAAWLMGSGLLGLAGVARRRRSAV
jgi:hypothetical protein